MKVLNEKEMATVSGGNLASWLVLNVFIPWECEAEDIPIPGG